MIRNLYISLNNRVFISSDMVVQAKHMIFQKSLFHLAFLKVEGFLTIGLWRQRHVN